MYIMLDYWKIIRLKININKTPSLKLKKKK